MRFEGEQTIQAPIASVWAFFMDPNQVAQCAPGLKSMEILGPDHYRPTVSVGIGPVKATFTLDVLMTAKQEPTHAEATARGNAAGTAVEMQGGMDLTEASPTATTMRWVANVNVSGKIASLGARLMESTANKLTARFFDCTRQKLEEQAGVTAPSPTTGASAE